MYPFIQPDVIDKMFTCMKFYIEDPTDRYMPSMDQLTTVKSMHKAYLEHCELLTNILRLAIMESNVRLEEGTESYLMFAYSENISTKTHLLSITNGRTSSVLRISVTEDHDAPVWLNVSYMDLGKMNAQDLIEIDHDGKLVNNITAEFIDKFSRQSLEYKVLFPLVIMSKIYNKSVCIRAYIKNKDKCVECGNKLDVVMLYTLDNGVHLPLCLECYQAYIT